MVIVLESTNLNKFKYFNRSNRMDYPDATPVIQFDGEKYTEVKPRICITNNDNNNCEIVICGELTKEDYIRLDEIDNYDEDDIDLCSLYFISILNDTGELINTFTSDVECNDLKATERRAMEAVNAAESMSRDEFIDWCRNSMYLHEEMLYW